MDKITDTLAPEDSTVGGLLVPGKDRVVFRPLKKSVLGMILTFIGSKQKFKLEGRQLLSFLILLFIILQD